MKMTLTESMFRDEFHRTERADQFSYEALGLIFDYFEDCDPDMEIDVIAICCEYSENMPEEIAKSYRIDIEGMDDGEILDAVTEYLEHNTSICGTTDSGAIVYQQF